MKYRNLGNTGLRVSKIGLGCMMFGWRVDTDEAERILHLSKEAGLNFIDTSVSYGGGASETVLGEALQRLHSRSDFIIATKVGLRSNQPDWPRNGRQNIVQQCEQSLLRLKIDHIDLLQLHRPSAETPIEETLGAMDDLVRRGFARFIGSSNADPGQLNESLACSKAKHFISFESEQSGFNLLERQAEKEIFPLASKHRLGIITYSPLAEGLLTGKYKMHQEFPSNSRFAMASKGDFRSRLTPATMAVVDEIATIAQNLEISPADLALSWVFNHEAISTTLVGPSSVKQMSDSLKIKNFDLEDSVVRELDRLTAVVE